MKKEKKATTPTPKDIAIERRRRMNREVEQSRQKPYETKGKGMMQIVPINALRRGVMIVIGDWDFLNTQLSENGYPEIGRQDLPTTPCCINMGNDAVIYMPTINGMVTLPKMVHEMVHAAKMILEQTDIKDEEAMAYLVEYLTAEVTSPSGVLSRWSSDASVRTSSSQSVRRQHCGE